MPTRPPDSTHEAERTQPLPPDDPRAEVQSPDGDLMQGANGLPPDGDADVGAQGDQDIDTAGTDMDEQSPTKSMGTGVAPNRPRG